MQYFVLSRNNTAARDQFRFSDPYRETDLSYESVLSTSHSFSKQRQQLGCTWTQHSSGLYRLCELHYNQHALRASSEGKDSPDKLIEGSHQHRKLQRLLLALLVVRIEIRDNVLYKTSAGVLDVLGHVQH